MVCSQCAAQNVPLVAAGLAWLCPACEAELAVVFADFETMRENRRAAKREACYTSPAAAFENAAKIWCDEHATIRMKRHGATVTGTYWTAGTPYAQSGGWFDVR